MTLAELVRLIDSRRRVQKIEAQEKAIFDYIQADLIGRSVARLHSSSNNFPTIEEAYPKIFDDKELQEQKQMQKEELSIIRFKQFAQSYNEKFDKEVAN